MSPIPALLSVAHLVGPALGLGAATVKCVLLLRSGSDRELLTVFPKVARHITPLIIAGLVLLVLSGVGWLVRGYPFSPRLVVKLVLVGSVFVMGPVIDNVVEPRFRRLAPIGGGPVSAEFSAVRKQYLALEVAATLLFYVITVLWVTR